MTAPLQALQNVLREIVLHYIHAQQIDIEPSFDARVNSAETQIRTLAEKRVPFLMFELLTHLHLLDKIEFEQPEANIWYNIHVIASIGNFTNLWEEAYQAHEHSTGLQQTLNTIHQLHQEAESCMQILLGYAASAKWPVK